MKKVIGVVAVLGLLTGSLSGCASIVSKSNWPVTIQSNPSGAKCTVAKKNGLIVHTGETPMILNLEASAGFFSGEDYTIKCSKDGQQFAPSTLASKMNGWYWGNIVFGGLIGLLIVDPVTGAMWKFDDTHVVNLTPSAPQKDVGSSPAI